MSSDHQNTSERHTGVTSEAPYTPAPPPSSNFSIGIVGAGASGIIALYECHKRGIHAVAYEASHNLGGVWNGDWADPQNPVHLTTDLNTTSYASCFNVTRAQNSLFDYMRQLHGEGASSGNGSGNSSDGDGGGVTGGGVPSCLDAHGRTTWDFPSASEFIDYLRYFVNNPHPVSHASYGRERVAAAAPLIDDIRFGHRVLRIDTDVERDQCRLEVQQNTNGEDDATAITSTTSTTTKRVQIVYHDRVIVCKGLYSGEKNFCDNLMPSVWPEFIEEAVTELGMGQNSKVNNESSLTQSQQPGESEHEHKECAARLRLERDEIRRRQHRVLHSSECDPCRVGSAARQVAQEARSVLVVGGGISSGEVVEEWIESAHQLNTFEHMTIYWSPSRDRIRRNFWILHRYLDGMPISVVNFMSRFYFTLGLPYFLYVITRHFHPLKLLHASARLSIPPDQLIVTKTRAIREAIRDGRLRVIGPIHEIRRASSTTAHDGLYDVTLLSESSETLRVDAILSATGYKIAPILINGRSVDTKTCAMYQRIVPIVTGCAGRVGFILNNTIGGSVIAAGNMQIIWLMRQWMCARDGLSDFHARMEQLDNTHEDELKQSHPECFNAQMLTSFEVFESLSKDIETQPNILRYLLHPQFRWQQLGLAIYLGPISLYQYCLADDGRITCSDVANLERQIVEAARVRFRTVPGGFPMMCTVWNSVYWMGLAITTIKLASWLRSFA